MNAIGDFAATLDAVITDPALRREIDQAPAATLARLGFGVSTAPVPAASVSHVAPPYVAVGPSVERTPAPSMFAPPYVAVGPAAPPSMVAPPYVAVGPSAG